MLRRHLEDRMLYLAFRRGWLHHGPLGEDLEALLDADPAQALKRLVEEGFLAPDQVKALEQDARSELARFLDLTQDMLRMPDATLALEPGESRSVAPADTGEFRIWAKAAGVMEGEPWGPYRILGLLGEGSVGRVFRALDPDLGRPVALKILQRTDPTTLERFLNEARAQARIEHPCVAKVYRVGEEGGQPYIAMQFVDGATLREAAPLLDLEAKVRIAAQVCEGVHAAHRLGIVHRDLKPSNIMLERTPDGAWRPVVLDFGLALTRESTGLTLAGHAVGTPKYMSPEQWRGVPLDRRSDVYSLGVTIYELLCGRAPFEGDHPLEVLRASAETEPPKPRRLNPELAEDLETILLKALEKDPAARYDSARALAQDLDRFLEGEPIAARPPSAWRLARRWFLRHRLASGITGVPLPLPVALGGWAAWAQLRSRAQAGAARLFGAESERIEVLLAKAYALPMHDVSRTEDAVRASLVRMKARIDELGSAAEGPGHLALGRARRALGEFDEAHRELTRAWHLGYRGPEMAAEFGRVKAALYRRHLTQRHGTSIEDGQKQSENPLRSSAEALLQLMPTGPLRETGLARAELALTRGRFDEAHRLAEEAFQAEPWLFEALVLKAEIHMVQAEEAAEAKRLVEARAFLQEAGEDLARAREIGRSAPSVYLAEARRAAQWVRVSTNAGLAREEDRVRALAACGEAQQLRPGSAQARLSRAAVHLHWVPWLRVQGRPVHKELELGVAAAEDALKLAPQSSEGLATLAFLWWRRAAVDEEEGRDPRPALACSMGALEQGLKQAEEAPALHLRLGNCYTTQALYELRSGVDPEASVAQAEAHYRESARLRTSGQPLSDLLWALSIRAQATYWRGGDPAGVGEVAEAVFTEAHRLIPDYFFTKVNLAEVKLVQAEARLARGLDPTDHLARAGDLARMAQKVALREDFPLTLLGRAALLRGEWTLRRGADPRTDLVEARGHLQAALAIRRERKDLPRLLLRVRLAELQAAPAWNRPAFESMARELSNLAGDAEAALLLGRLQALAGRRAEAASRPGHLASARASLRRAAGLNPNLAELAEADLRALGDPGVRADARPGPSPVESNTHGL